MDKYTGKKLDGRYEIRELIGVGGMANVYHSYDTIDDREVAIKILKDEFLDNDDFIRRFKNESKAIAVLSHPNIVKVYDVSFGDMIQYIVMEYIDGITLKEYIAIQGVIDWKETLHLTTQILKALQHAHERGIIHRDIKPQNIMLLQDGTIKVTDFGIARFSNNATRTMTAQAIGSVHYIAPEQARGEVTDGKTDIYSVGVMLYEMLTGKLPFEADNAVSVALMQLQSIPKMPHQINPNIPEGLEEITIKAMQKVPSERYASAQDMLNDIERFRLNPSIRFEYKYFIDEQPTKYVNAIKKQKGSRTKSYNDNYSDFEYDEQYDDDEVKTQSKPVVAAIKGVGIAAVLVIIIFGVLASVKGCNSSQAKDVDVPNYIGKTLSAVQEENANKFNLVYESEYDKTKEIGVVLEQDPAPEYKKIKEGATITLTVNGTETKVKSPYLINESEADAIKYVQEKNLTPQILYIADAEAPVGYVKNVFPSAGVEINIGSTVYIYVSKGPQAEKVSIPNITGFSYADAKSKLEELGLDVEATYDNECTKPKNEVILQTPLYGGKVDKGYKVSLLLSGGKEIESKVSIYVDLPASETRTVPLEVIVNGVVDSTNSKSVVPNLNTTYTVTLKGTGKINVLVKLDGNDYREYTVDFSTKTVTPGNRYDYPPTEPVTEPITEPTTANTEPETQAPEPTDEPTTDDNE